MISQFQRFSLYGQKSKTDILGKEKSHAPANSQLYSYTSVWSTQESQQMIGLLELVYSYIF